MSPWDNEWPNELDRLGRLLHPSHLAPLQLDHDRELAPCRVPDDNKDVRNDGRRGHVEGFVQLTASPGRCAALIPSSRPSCAGWQRRPRTSAIAGVLRPGASPALFPPARWRGPDC